MIRTLGGVTSPAGVYFKLSDATPRIRHDTSRGLRHILPAPIPPPPMTYPVSTCDNVCGSLSLSPRNMHGLTTLNRSPLQRYLAAHTFNKGARQQGATPKGATGFSPGGKNIRLRVSPTQRKHKLPPGPGSQRSPGERSPGERSNNSVKEGEDNQSETLKSLLMSEHNRGAKNTPRTDDAPKSPESTCSTSSSIISPVTMVIKF